MSIKLDSDNIKKNIQYNIIVDIFYKITTTILH